ncbi:MAG: hypothetical protein R6V59_04480 [Dehalococcoidia bacterium]
MPRLSDHRITQGHAVSFLLRHYFDEKEFVAELQELHEKNLELLAEWVLGWANFLTKCSEVMTADEYLGIARDVWGSAAAGKGIPDLPANFAPQFEEFKQLIIKSGPYFRELEQLAFRWKLRAPWAGPMLHYRWLHDSFKELGFPDTIEMSLEQLDLPYPWPPLMPPLEIKVSAWAFVFYSRREIQAEIAGKLKSYEDKLKAAGLREKPSALENHARWWFEHYVKGKTYGELAQQFPRAYEETIKRKVWEFSKLAGIETR